MNSFEESLKVPNVSGKIVPGQSSGRKDFSKANETPHVVDVKTSARRAVLQAINSIQVQTPQDVVYKENLKNLLPDIVQNFDVYSQMFAGAQNHGIPIAEEKQKKFPN